MMCGALNRSCASFLHHDDAASIDLPEDATHDAPSARARVCACVPHLVEFELLAGRLLLLEFLHLLQFL